MPYVREDFSQNNGNHLSSWICRFAVVVKPGLSWNFKENTVFLWNTQKYFFFISLIFAVTSGGRRVNRSLGWLGIGRPQQRLNALILSYYYAMRSWWWWWWWWWTIIIIIDGFDHEQPIKLIGDQRERFNLRLLRLSCAITAKILKSMITWTNGLPWSNCTKRDNFAAQRWKV